jgi:mannosyltransferase
MNNHNAFSWTHSRQLYPILILLITLLAAFLRFFKLGEWGFWLDEIYTVEAALGKASSGNTYQSYPISYWLIGAAFWFFGTNEWVARLVPALIGTISIPILYSISKRIASVEASLVAALLLAVSPWHIYWSQNARFYTLLLLFCTISVLTFYIGLEKDSLTHFFAALVFLGLGIFTHTSAILIVPGAFIYVLILNLLSRLKRYQVPPGFRLQSLLIFLVPGSIFGFTAACLLFSGRSKLLQSIAEKVAFTPVDPVRLSLAFVFYIGITITCFAIASTFYSIFVKRDRLGLMLITNAFTPLVTLAVISVFFFVFNRYIFMSLYIWILLAAYGLTHLLLQPKFEVKILATGALLIMLLIPLSENLLYYQYQNGNREDWRSAFEFIKQNYQTGDKVVVTFPAAGRYYFREEFIDIRDLYPEEIDPSTRYWFVENDAIDWGFPAQEWILDNAMVLTNYDVHINSARTYKMRVLLYSPPEDQ